MSPVSLLPYSDEKLNCIRHFPLLQNWLKNRVMYKCVGGFQESNSYQCNQWRLRKFRSIGFLAFLLLSVEIGKVKPNTFLNITLFNPYAKSFQSLERSIKAVGRLRFDLTYSDEWGFGG